MPNQDRTQQRVRRAWCTAAQHVLTVALLIATPIFCASTLQAHEGHDHDKPPPLNLPVAPRVVAVTPDYELVGVLSGAHRLTIFLHRFETGEPVAAAKLTASNGGTEVAAVAKEDGVFEVSAPWIGGAESIDIVFNLVLANDQDILTGRLELVSAAAGAVAPTAAIQSRPVLYLSIGAGMVGLLLTLFACGRLARRRQSASDQNPNPSVTEESVEPSPPQVRRLRRAPVLLLAGLVTGWFLGAGPVIAQESAKLPSVPATMATDQPQRMADGTLFVPKATQHLLSIRTMLPVEAQAPRAAQLAGLVVADPNSFGRVQSARPGRIEAPNGGVAHVGKQVKKGELLGYLLPYIEQADKANIESQIAEAEARIAKLRTILSRYNERPGSVPQVKIDEIEGELNALLRKRAELQPSLVAREEIRAPIAGTVSVANVVAGQIVEARDILFDIVDPARFWIEAIAHDPTITANLGQAFAVTSSGEKLPLEFAGVGLSLKQQAAPLSFKVTQTSPHLSIGKPVTVILQSTVELGGIVVPAASVVRAPSGLSVVWVKSEAERFEPRTVRYEPLDGQRVVILAGLKPDLRVVTQGATLLNQIR